MLMQNFGGTNKEHYGMLWYFWSGQLNLVRCNHHELSDRAVRQLSGQAVHKIRGQAVYELSDIQRLIP